ncbi:hypothetical protein BGZ99_003792 [Dissophora globulifera]|uniref:Mtf2-like C-terminal domain-containing protein n=1 Tax=Dissophora globulifera TaxID=979702 RepID=A0A9P6UVK7_9FUNG|nr:hypothetical protein BGZ99_003792 [Dissophora globulifera]
MKNIAMRRIPETCRFSLQTGAGRRVQPTRTIFTSSVTLQDTKESGSDDTTPPGSTEANSAEFTKTRAEEAPTKEHSIAVASTKESGNTKPTEGTATKTEVALEQRIKEDLTKKFNLKPSVEVGIRARLQERQRKQAEREAKRLAAEAEAKSEEDKVSRLFEKLQWKETDPRSAGPSAAGGKPGSDSWKFLFDEDDLGDKRNKKVETTISTLEGGSGAETLDRIPGVADIFPSLSDYRSSSTSSPSSTPAAPDTITTTPMRPGSDRWKDAKMKSADRDAFKALFSSLFEQKKPSEREATAGQKMQSLFSNFNRTGRENTIDGNNNDTLPSDTARLPLFGSLATDSSTPTPSKTSDSDASNSDDPMQVLRRQLEGLSKRVEPIYLTRKPNTPSFEVMKSTVGPQDWITRDPTMPQDNNLFNAIRDENKVAIRMRKELDEKRNDIIKVQEFVDELITPFLHPDSSLSSDVVRPSSVSLDSLLSHAILAASSTRLGSGEQRDDDAAGKHLHKDTDFETERSLHPFLGHAMIEHTRRQGLPVFIRTVRTESYKALLKCRWDCWFDGPGCLEILKEMQRNGALVDSETKSLVRSMKKDLRTVMITPKAASTDDAVPSRQVLQYGWGDEEQAAPIQEMLNIIEVAYEDGDNEYNMKQWAKRGRPPTSQ